MRAMVLETSPGTLVLRERPAPSVGPGEVCVRVEVCGVCRTDLHIVDGELALAGLAAPRLPLIPGHQVVGRVEEVGESTHPLVEGQRVGIPWLGGTCGACSFCVEGAENLCDFPTFTGYDRDGGYAEAVVARAAFCLPIPDDLDAREAAPLLCAGLIGYRAYRMVPPAPRARRRKIGLYGFGAAAHLLCQVAVFEGDEIYAFTRPGDDDSQRLARELGASYAGPSSEASPASLDAALVFAPDGALVPTALKAVRKAGVVVCAGIHMSDIPSFPYADLWGERVVRSVANLTRDDGAAFLDAAARAGVRARITTYPLAEANRALDDLRRGKITGAAVLVV